MPSAAADPTDKPEHTAWSAHPFATDAARASVEALEADGALGDDALHRLGVRVGVTDLGDGPVYTVGVAPTQSVRNPAIPDLPPPETRVLEPAPLTLDPAVEEAWLAPRGLAVEVWAAFDATDMAAELPDYRTFMARAALEGRLQSQADVLAERAAYTAVRYEAFEPYDLADRAVLEAAGFEVLGSVPASRAYRVATVDHDLDRLLDVPHLVRVEIEEVQEDTCDYPLGAGVCNQVFGFQLDGREIADLNQATQFYYDGGSGGFSGDPNTTIAFHDSSSPLPGVHVEHFGFLDAAGSRRMRNCEDFNLPYCVEFTCLGLAPPNPDWCYNGHATGAASIGLGDVTHGQLAYSPIPPGSYGIEDQRRRSGVARTSQGIYVQDHRHSYFPSMLAHENVTISSGSLGMGHLDNCKGQNTAAQAYNEVYEAGFPHFNSGSNEGNSDPTDCRVKGGASAHGVLAVGTYNIVDNVPVTDPQQSRGGTATEGRGRTIIAFQAPNPMKLSTYPRFQWPEDANGPWYFGSVYSYAPPMNPQPYPNTSAAAPAASGSAALMQHHFSVWYSPGFAYEPGNVYTNMLLSGDRSLESGTLATEGYDGLHGAGRLRLRRFDQWGLDAPYSWNSGDDCVEHGHDVYIPLGLVPQDVGIIKAVAWFYDPMHDDPTWSWQHPSYHNTIDLALEKLDNGVWSTVREDQGGTDNKRRVATTGVAVQEYRLRLTGSNVEMTQCGVGAARVYWAYYFEDRNHDSGSPLMNFIRTE